MKKLKDSSTFLARDNRQKVVRLIIVPINHVLKKMGLQGSISPNFFRQAKIRRRTACREKFAVQFHQNSTSNCTKICPVFELKFAQFVSKNLPNLCAVRQTLLPFAKYVRQKKLLILCRRKCRRKC